MKDCVAFAHRIYLADERAAYHARREAFATSGRSVATMVEFEKLHLLWRAAKERLHAFARAVVE